MDIPVHASHMPVPQTMRALVLDGVGFDHVSIRNVPTPRPGPHQILARVDAAGICTSLIKLIEQGPVHHLIYGWDVRRWPLILGDEGSITLVEVGEELSSRFNAGERYVIQPAVDHSPINFRDRYREGALGIHKLGVGYTLAGHLAEYILITEEIIRAGCLIPLPCMDFPFAHAALSEPISCVISSQDHHLHLKQDDPLGPREVFAGLRPGGVTVIIGAGAMGRMHVDAAIGYSPRTIIVSDFLPARLELVRTLFGTRAARCCVALHTCNSGQSSLKGIVDEVTSHAGADDVIVAVGSKQAILEAQCLVGRGAILNLFGALKKGDDIVGMDTGVVHYKEINITGSSGGSPYDVAHTLELMARGAIEPGAHITRIGDLEHAVELLNMVRSQQIDGKALVYPHRHTPKIVSVNSWSVQDERSYLGES